SILASHYGGDFHTSETTSQIIALKHKLLLRRTSLHKREMDDFWQTVTADFPSVKEIINSKGRTFKDFLSLLDSATKFKEWTEKVHPDKKIVKEYFDEC